MAAPHLQSQQQHVVVDFGIDEGSEMSSSIPSVDRQQSLNFIDSQSVGNGTDSGALLDGQMDMQAAPAESDVPLNDSAIHHRTGVAADFLTKKGFGWLMDEELDEEDTKPILEELDIDVKDIYHKLRCVLLPLPYFKVNRDVVRDSPDFWGPLAVVFLYSIISLYGQLSVVSWIMTIWLFGSAMIFVLARVLGGEVNYSQCLGVIGYSVLPLLIVGLVLPLTHSVPVIHTAIKLLGVVWATYSAGSLLCVEELQNKRVLLLYPLFLLFVYFFSLYSGV